MRLQPLYFVKLKLATERLVLGFYCMKAIYHYLIWRKICLTLKVITTGISIMKIQNKVGFTTSIYIILLL